MSRQIVRRIGKAGMIAAMGMAAAVGCSLFVPFLQVPFVGTVATPGAQQSIVGFYATVGDTVPLNGTAAGGVAPIHAAWVQLQGPPITITDANMMTASFVPKAAGKYQFQLTLTDSSVVPFVITTNTDIITVGDIEFFAEGVREGNPATEQVNYRDNVLEFQTSCRVFDPDFISDDLTQMTVRYEIVSIPAAARAKDVTLQRAFDTISNQGTGDVNAFSFGESSLDGTNEVEVWPNPDSQFSVLTNLATTVTAHGAIVPGDYTFRATVTNPNGVERFRNLVVTVFVQGLEGPLGTGGQYDAAGAGPRAVAVKQLPMGSPGQVTDKVLLPNQSSSMVVSVFPATDTSYRFYLRDNNGVGNSNIITQSATQVAATGSPVDVTLTIGSSAGLPVGDYRLWMETFDSYAQLFNTEVTVNNQAGPGSGNSIHFHVTKDFFNESHINAAQVGAASSSIDQPVNFEGWSGGSPGYGLLNALGDVNGDGAPDIVTSQTNGFRVMTQGFIDGSIASLRHPVNHENFDNSLGSNFLTNISNTTTPINLAVGDLNGDGRADVAISFQSSGVGRVQIFYNTGNPAQPFSGTADQDQFILAPTYENTLFQDDANPNNNTEVGPGFFGCGALQNPTISTRAQFGARIAIANVVGDSTPDLIITDPGFGRLEVYDQAGPKPAMINQFFNNATGRVYVYAGGTGGQLQPGRPDLTASRLVNTARMDIGACTAVSTSLNETEVTYSSVFEGENALDSIGYSLAATNGTFAVGNPAAQGDGRPFVRLVINIDLFGGVIADGASLMTSFGGVSRTYEFDTNAAVGAGNVAVDISGAGNNFPVEALRRLIDTINADADRVVDASNDAILPIPAAGSPATDDDVAIVLTGIGTGGFGALDEAVRNSIGVTSNVVTNNINGISNGMYSLGFNRDGIVERLSGAVLGNSIVGTVNSSMGLGATLAIGNINNSGGKNDLVIGALDSGAALGFNNGFTTSTYGGDGITDTDDGAVFVVLDGATTLPAKVAGVGADTALAQFLTNGVTPTSVGAAVAVGDLNGDGIDDVVFTEPGFDTIHVIKGAASPSTSPNIKFDGVVFNGGLTVGGTFVFGDVTGDTNADWLYISNVLNFGLAAVHH